MSRTLVIVLLLVALLSPALVLAGQGTPAPDRDGSPAASNGVPVPTRAARPLPPSTPEPGPAEQPGLFASGPELTQRNPAGPFLRGDDDQLAVVGIHPDDSGDAVLVTLRNTTGSDSGAVELVATLSDESGDAVALGITTAVVPEVIVPGGLGFALIQLEGAGGVIDADNLPRITVNQPDAGGTPPVVDLRLVSATVNATDVIAAVVVEDTAEERFSSIQTVAVCVRLAGPNHLAVGGWTSSETLFEISPRPGDSQTIRISAPLNCGDRFIVAVASR